MHINTQVTKYNACTLTLLIITDLPATEFDCTYTGPEAGRWCSVLAGLPGSVSHHLAVDGTANTVMQLHVQLGQYVCYIGGTTAI